jgi:hypothetical protein
VCICIHTWIHSSFGGECSVSMSRETWYMYMYMYVCVYVYILG